MFLVLCSRKGGSLQPADDSFCTGWENEAERQKMKLLELAGIFVPEEWSFTFFEG
jgi:hypothetical protein